MDDGQPRITEADGARAVALRLQGLTWQAIADEIGMSRQSVYEWRKREGIDEQLSALRAEVTESVRLKLLDLTSDAVEALRSVLKDTRQKACDRIAAAREVFRALEARPEIEAAQHHGEEERARVVIVDTATEEEHAHLARLNAALHKSGERVHLIDREDATARARELVLTGRRW